jgi:DNA-binding MarR family transcriptional regulator
VLDDAVAAVLAAYPTIHTALRRRLEQRRSRGTRLSPQLAQLLEQLDPVRLLAVGELAARMRVTPATISLQLTRLARLRLVTRTRDESDGRRVQLRLTEAGVRLRGQRSLLDPERVRGALARLSPADQDAVAAGVRLLARVARSVSSPDMGPTPSSQRNRES